MSRTSQIDEAVEAALCRRRNRGEGHRRGRWRLPARRLPARESASRAGAARPHAGAADQHRAVRLAGHPQRPPRHLELTCDGRRPSGMTVLEAAARTSTDELARARRDTAPGHGAARPGGGVRTCARRQRRHPAALVDRGRRAAARLEAGGRPAQRACASWSRGGVRSDRRGWGLMIPVMKPWLGEEEAGPPRTRWPPAGSRRARGSPSSSSGSPSASAPSTASPSPRARPPCTSRCICWASGPATRSSSRRSRSSPPRTARVYVGATPVFADVEPEDGNLSAATVERRAHARTRAVLVVHQGGCRRMSSRCAGCAPPRHRARRGRRLRGGLDLPRCARRRRASEIAAWSFHPRKLLTTGEGGMLTTSDAGLGGARPPAARARHERQCGRTATAAASRCSRATSRSASTTG